MSQCVEHDQAEIIVRVMAGIPRARHPDPFRSTASHIIGKQLANLISDGRADRICDLAQEPRPLANRDEFLRENEHVPAAAFA